MHVTVHAQFTPYFGYQHFVEPPQLNLPDYTNSPNLSLTFGLFPDFLLTLAEFLDISRFPDIPESGNLVHRQTITSHLITNITTIC